MSLDSQILDRPVFKDLPRVEATLNYLIPMAEKPVNYTYEPPLGVPRQNGEYEAQTLPILDARPITRNLSLDREGFALTVHRSAVRDFYDEDEVRRVYYPEAEQLLAEATGAYNPTHRWFYFPQIQPNEALLIKCFDSAEDGRARFAAHTAFDDPTSPLDAPPRESIDLRTLVFYPA